MKISLASGVRCSQAILNVDVINWVLFFLKSYKRWPYRKTNLKSYTCKDSDSLILKSKKWHHWPQFDLAGLPELLSENILFLLAHGVLNSPSWQLYGCWSLISHISFATYSLLTLLSALSKDCTDFLSTQHLSIPIEHLTNQSTVFLPTLLKPGIAPLIAKDMVTFKVCDHCHGKMLPQMMNQIFQFNGKERNKGIQKGYRWLRKWSLWSERNPNDWWSFGSWMINQLLAF